MWHRFVEVFRGAPGAKHPVSGPAVQRGGPRRTAGTKIVACIALALVLHGCGGMTRQPAGGDFNAALSLMKKKDYRQAVNAFKAVIAGNDKHAGAYINLGIAYTELGERDEARQALLAAIERNPRNAVAYNQLGIVYRQSGQFKKARRAYEKSIGRESKYSKPYLNLGILCDIYLQNMRCALANYEKYQALTKGKDEQVALWIKDLKQRTR